MNRLTEPIRYRDGVIYRLRCEESESCSGAETCSEPCKVKAAAIDRLAEYENKSVMPEEISDHQKEIIEAEREGRLVIVPEPCEDIDWFRVITLIVLDAAGRIIEIPNVPDRDRESIRDSLYDYMQEWTDDPSVGLHGPNDGERALMQALIDGLLLKEGKDAD